MLICPAKSVYSYIDDETKELTWKPHSYNLENIINYGYSDMRKWYGDILFRGKKVAIGVKYH
jgi:hypothetical protein